MKKKLICFLQRPSLTAKKRKIYLLEEKKFGRIGFSFNVQASQNYQFANKYVLNCRQGQLVHGRSYSLRKTDRIFPQKCRRKKRNVPWKKF